MHSFQGRAKPMLEEGVGFLQCLLCDMRLRGVNSLLCRRGGGGSSSVAMSKLHMTFCTKENQRQIHVFE